MAVNSSQIVVEVFLGPGGIVRVSQTVQETWIQFLSPVHIGQIVLEVLIPNVGVVMAIYPTLIGLGFSVHKKPMYSTGIGKAASGKQVRVAYYAVPLWEWDLTYEYLPDKPANGTTASDLKTLMGFFVNVRGGLLPFQFLDPDDHAITNQLIGVGDGVTTSFQLARQFNGDATAPLEPIGVLNQSAAFNVYLNGTLQPGANYTISTATAVNQTIAFVTAPGAGVTITVDMSWYFWVTFKDDTLDFEKFMDKLWMMKQITLVSQRN